MSIERFAYIRKSSKSIRKMCISKKRGRYSQSYVEVILSIENVPKIYQKCAPDRHQGHLCWPLVASLTPTCCLLVVSSSHVGGFRTLRGSRKNVYNLFMGSFGPILLPTWRHLDPTWIQLGSNLDLTWHQLQPTCENPYQSDPKVIKK